MFDKQRFPVCSLKKKKVLYLTEVFVELNVTSSVINDTNNFSLFKMTHTTPQHIIQ